MHFKKDLKIRIEIGFLFGALLAVLGVTLALDPAGDSALSVLPLRVVSPARASSLQQSAADGQALFQQKCRGCHSIGGGTLVGPDLLDVGQRRDIAWIKSFITAPDQMIASGDPIATKLVEQFIAKMPNLGLSSDQVDALVAYLENPAAAGPAQPQSAAVMGNAGNGQKLFTGQIALANGGPPCMACHTVSGVGALGGGNLGPNLTHVVQRLGGQPGLAGALSTLPFPTMQGIFANRLLTTKEQADLLAYFVNADRQPPTPLKTPINWLMLGLGLLGGLVLLALMGIYWPRQRRNMADILNKNV